jgi:predicted nucleic acid-binding protein
MSVFFDTNVLVYCTDRAQAVKRAKALALVEEHGSTGEAVVSTQILIELYSVLINKQKVPRKSAAELVDHYCLWQVVESDLALVRNAVALTLAHSLSIWDAMVIEAAQRARVATLFSEDMADGMRYGTVRVSNPFLGGR